MDAVVVWQIDRLCRRTADLASTLDLLEKRGALLATVSGDVDPSTAAGRLVLELLGSVAQHEVRLKGERQRLANRQRAEAGRAPAGGRRLYGFGRDGMHIPSEVRDVKSVTDGLLAGESLRALCSRLNEQGARTTAGGPWRPTELRRLLANPRLAGLAVHQGQVVGKGGWEPILDGETHEQVLAIFADPRRRSAGRPRRYLLSGVATCAVCGSRLFGTTHTRVKAGVYKCESRKHVQRRCDHVDEFVEEVVIARLSRTDAVELFIPAARTDELSRLRASEAQIREKLQTLATAFAQDRITLEQLTSATSRLRGELERVTCDLATAVRHVDVSPLLLSADVASAWRQLPVQRRRRILSELVEVTVRPPGRGARYFDPDSVELRWRSLNG